VLAILSRCHGTIDYGNMFFGFLFFGAQYQLRIGELASLIIDGNIVVVFTHLMKFLFLLNTATVDNVHVFSMYCVCDGGVILC
jgi:hypothetical protein